MCYQQNCLTTGLFLYSTYKSSRKPSVLLDRHQPGVQLIPVWSKLPLLTSLQFPGLLKNVLICYMMRLAQCVYHTTLSSTWFTLTSRLSRLAVITRLRRKSCWLFKVRCITKLINRGCRCLTRVSLPTGLIIKAKSNHTITINIRGITRPRQTVSPGRIASSIVLFTFTSALSFFSWPVAVPQPQCKVARSQESVARPFKNFHVLNLASFPDVVQVWVTRTTRPGHAYALGPVRPWPGALALQRVWTCPPVPQWK